MTHRFNLKSASSKSWLAAVLADFDVFLADHAANERKASSMALSLVAHYPDKPELLNAMIDLALEELIHFKQVVKVMNKRALILQPDRKDPYVNSLRKHMRDGSRKYFLDRLLCASVIEARGAERFALVADNVEDPDLQSFYSVLAKSEANHHHLFVELANHYFDDDEVVTRFDEWAEIEQQVLKDLPIHARLH
jgi:tRNA 2-(methylsulfanyl)-N6-isopentenyladenosine37 hydroxylase